MKTSRRIGRLLFLRDVRQADAKVRAGELAVHDLDRAAVRLHEFAHDGKPDARALQRSARGAWPDRTL